MKGYTSDSARIRRRILAILTRYAAATNPALRSLRDELLSALTEEEARAKPLTTPAQILGQRGGNKGGVARAQLYTKEERVALAKKAARKRWDAVREAKAQEKETDDDRVALGLRVVS